MAKLSETIQLYVDSLADDIVYCNDAKPLYRGSTRKVDICNHDVFNKFFIIDIKEGRDTQVPILFSSHVISRNLADRTTRFIKPLYVGSTFQNMHRRFSSILKQMYIHNSISLGCTEHNTNKGEKYYTYGNILFDNSFNPLIVPCYNIRFETARSYIVTEIVFKISNSIFDSDARHIEMAKSYISSKIVPYLAGNKVHKACITNSSIKSWMNNVPIRVEIGDINDYVCRPTAPSDNFQEEANAILNVMIDDILKTNY